VSYALDLNALFVLLVLFQLKHFIADYPLQIQFMLKKFSDKFTEWFPALLSHACIHGILTTIIILLVEPSLWYLGFLDLITHFTIDLLKASKRIGSRWTPQNKFFWWALGLDQMLHHLTHYFIIYQLL
jgi:hypothetical protein